MGLECWGYALGTHASLSILCVNFLAPLVAGPRVLRCLGVLVGTSVLFFFFFTFFHHDHERVRLQRLYKQACEQIKENLFHNVPEHEPDSLLFSFNNGLFDAETLSFYAWDDDWVDVCRRGRERMAWRFVWHEGQRDQKRKFDPHVNH